MNLSKRMEFAANHLIFRKFNFSIRTSHKVDVNREIKNY